MGALDRLMQFNAKSVDLTSDVFDVKTPEGAFFSLVHRHGFKLYEKDESGEVKYTELYYILKQDGNMCVNAIAGSGKTSSLVFKIIHDIVTGETMNVKSVPGGSLVRVVDRVWVCTFLNTGASELKDSIETWQRRLGYTQTADQVTCSTMDAEFKRCLNAMGVSVNIGEDSKLYGMLKKSVDACNITRSGYPLTKEDYRVIQTIVTYHRGRLDSKRYQHPSMADYGITPRILDMIVSQYAALRQAAGVMDFDEVMELLYRYLYVTPNANVQDFVASRYNYIYADEFQDTSQLQYAILKYYGRDCKKFLAIGDPSQCIYSFKGADSSIFVKDFINDFSPAKLTLSYNYRCPKNILDPVVPSIHKNWDSEDQKIIAFNEGGDFGVFEFQSTAKMLGFLTEELDKDLAAGNSVAILCRNNFDGIIPAVVLESGKSVNFSISGEGMTFDSPLPRKLLGVSSLFLEKSSPAVKNSLELICTSKERWGINQLIDTLKTNSRSVWDMPSEDLEYSVPSVAQMVKAVRGDFYVNGVRDKSLEIRALKHVYGFIYGTFAGDSLYCENARAYIDTILYLIESRNYKTVFEFAEDVDTLNDSLHARIKKKQVPIRIATVHEFKGKEADSVYIWNDVDGVFPSQKTNMDDEEAVNEERRVHYIACTRARKKGYILTRAGNVSMFVREMACHIQTSKLQVILNQKE